MDDIRAILSLLFIEGLGAKGIGRLLDLFDRAADVFEAPVSMLQKLEGMTPQIINGIRNRAGDDFAEHQAREAVRLGIRLISMKDREYPVPLKRLHDPPVLLFVAGEMPDSWDNALAVVGTRRPTPYGLKIAENLSRDIVRRGGIVVSGMARGVDALAHHGALSAEGKTVAVLGSGVDVAYPPENGKLYDRIRKQGVVISEYPIGTQPLPHMFPRRNRIVSGLCRGVVVVEAGPRSGALITAFLGLEQGKEVFAVPGRVRDIQSRGPHRLIKQGAKLVESVEDILEEFPDWDSGIQSIHTPNRSEEIAEPALSGEELAIFSLLSREPVHVDWLAEKTGLNTPLVLTHLLNLELQGIVVQKPGMVFLRK